MTQTFVRYGPAVEQEEPNFEQTLRQVLDDMKQHMRGSLKTEGIGRVVRNAHAKGYGLVRGEVEILSGMPSEYAQGIYARPGRHEAMVRFSNGTNHVGGDRFLGPITGIGLKMFGIEGKTLLEDEPNSHTFDYALINHPVFFVNPTPEAHEPSSGRVPGQGERLTERLVDSITSRKAHRHGYHDDGTGADGIETAAGRSEEDR